MMAYSFAYLILSYQNQSHKPPVTYTVHYNSTNLLLIFNRIITIRHSSHLPGCLICIEPKSLKYQWNHCMCKENLSWCKIIWKMPNLRPGQFCGQAKPNLRPKMRSGQSWGQTKPLRPGQARPVFRVFRHFVDHCCRKFNLTYIKYKNIYYWLCFYNVI